ncbi:MAG: hypothetical protein AAF628_13785 [Planctomycetota bacterium]
MRDQLAVIGLILAIVALGVAVFADGLRGATAPSAPAEPRSIKERTLEAGKKLLREKLLDGPTEESILPTRPRDTITLAPMGPGLLAIVLGIVAWICKARARLAGATIAVGLVAAAWQYVVVGLIVAVVVLVLGNFGG